MTVYIMYITLKSLFLLYFVCFTTFFFITMQGVSLLKKKKKLLSSQP